jgi:hypothetical protein
VDLSRRGHLEVENDPGCVEIAAPELDDFGNDVPQIDGGRRPGLLAAEAGQVADDLARPAALRLQHRDLFERPPTSPAGARGSAVPNRLERVLQFMSDTRHEHAHGRAAPA